MWARLRDERGQAMAELAIAMPLLAFILFAIVQFGITFNHYLNLTDAVRAGARQAVVTHDTGKARQAVLNGAPGLANLGSIPGKSEIDVNPGALNPDGTIATGSDVTVTATYPFTITLLGMTIYDGSLSSSTTERVE
jgi:Flp pilus assembly protein TadG